jgi:hypothetical protein
VFSLSFLTFLPYFNRRFFHLSFAFLPELKVLKLSARSFLHTTFLPFPPSVFPSFRPSVLPSFRSYYFFLPSFRPSDPTISSFLFSFLPSLT